MGNFAMGGKILVRMDGRVQFQFVPEHGVMASRCSDRPVGSDIGDGVGIYVPNRHRLCPALPTTDNGGSSDNGDWKCGCRAAVTGPVATVYPAADVSPTATWSTFAGAAAAAVAVATAVAGTTREEAAMEGSATRRRSRSASAPIVPIGSSDGPATVGDA